MAAWEERLSQHKSGHATFVAIRPLFEKWLERRHGDLTYRLTYGGGVTCPAWAEHRRVLEEAIGGDDLSLPALVEAMVSGGPEVWEAVTSFCETVMARRRRGVCGSTMLPTFAFVAAREKARCDRRLTTISGHRRRGFVGGEQRVAHRPTRNEPVSTARCVPRAPQRAASNC